MKINGKEFEIAGEMPLEAVLIEAGYDPKAVALEKNKQLIRRADMSKTWVVDEDVLEVFSFTGGG